MSKAAIYVDEVKCGTLPKKIDGKTWYDIVCDLPRIKDLN